MGGTTFVLPPGGTGGWAIAGAPPSPGGTGGTRPPTAGNFGGTSLTVPRTTGGVIRGGTTTSPYGGRGGTITGTAGRGGTAGTMMTAGRGGTSGRTSTTGGRGGTSGGTSATAGRGGTSGGATALGGSSGSSSSACPVIAPDEDLIDDMNDGNRYIPTNSGRAGAWNVSHDASPDGTMVPANSSSFTMTETGDPCRKKAVYTYGSLFVEWGANVWVSLGAPYNASKYRGISFWAKVDSGSSAGLRVSFPDKDTQPDGGLCQVTASSGPTACFDHYGKQLLLTGEWQKYTVLFSEITQRRWGRQGTAFDPSSLFEILFQIPVTANFALWIDDISFLLLPDLY